MVKAREILQGYIDEVSRYTGIPSGLVKVEMADEIGADPNNLTEEDVKKMIEHYESTYEGVRICESCGKAMMSGFCVNDGEACYCSKECLHIDYSEEDYLEMYESGEAYWTEW